MLKVICSLMAMLFVLSVLFGHSVESRALHQNYEGIPALQIPHLRFGDGYHQGENYVEADQDGHAHTKRKSDFLLSLYGLPYTLVNKRNVH